MDQPIVSKLWLSIASRHQRFLAGLAFSAHKHKRQASSLLASCAVPGQAAHSFCRFAKKGDRTLQRFRLEIVPMNADNISAGCKPHILFLCWAFQRKNPTFAASKTRKQMDAFVLNVASSESRVLRSA